LVGVSEYSVPGCIPLPFCRNDIFAVKSALIKGINLKEDDIYLCGEKRTVGIAEFFYQ
jgi:hypothetical protein